MLFLICKKLLPNARSWRVTCMFSVRVLWVLTFRSLIHFELFFAYGVRYGSNFILLHVDILHYLLKRQFFLPLNCLVTLVENQLTINVRVYFCTLNSIPLIYKSILIPVPHCLDYCSFVVSFEIGKCKSSNFVFLFQDYFVYFESLTFLWLFFKH